MCKTEGNYGLEKYAGLCQLRRQYVILIASLLPLASGNLQMLWLATGLAYCKTNIFWLSTHWLE